MSEEKVAEPKVEEPKAEPKASDKLQAIMAKLDEYGIREPEQLDNKVKAASESGRLANMVGELREEIKALKSQPVAPPTPPSEYNESDGIDIDAAIGNAVSKALDAREKKARDLQLARVREAQSIRSNDNYKLVGKDFEQYMTSPDAHARLSGGETPTTIFNSMVIGKYRELMGEMAGAIKGNPDQVEVPHMLSDQTAPPRTTPADEKKGKLKNIRENWTGNDEDIERVLNTLLPSGSMPMPNR